MARQNQYFRGPTDRERSASSKAPGGTKRGVRQSWPPCLATLLLWTTLSILLTLSLRLNHHRVVYALDDAYIHMAIAKNFAQHGLWGVTPFRFTSTSSSPLWTLLLSACTWVFGTHHVTPLALNVVFGTLLVFTLGRVLKLLNPSLPAPFVFGVILSILFLAPIPNLVFTGLEHVLHTLLTLLLVSYASQILSGRIPVSRTTPMKLAGLGLLNCGARYEGLLAVGVLALFLSFRRQVRPALGLVLGSLLPGLVIGLVSVHHGWFWLPNSVLLKGNLPRGSGEGMARFVGHVGANLTSSGLRVVRLMAVSLLLMLYRTTTRKERGDLLGWFLGTFAATGLFHIVLAGTGWFYRYEAYLVALGLVAVAAPLYEFVRQFPRTLRMPAGQWAGLTALVLFLLSLSLLGSAGYTSLRITPRATNNTYQWHYQMGVFARRYYQGASLAVNDIGAINFMADIDCTDFHGLADLKVARAMLENRFNPQVMDDLARSRKAEALILDDNWLGLFGGTPRPWLLAGRWKFNDRVVLAPPVLCFYALDEQARARLITNLRDFSSRLPAEVEQVGPNTLRADSWAHEH